MTARERVVHVTVGLSPTKPLNHHKHSLLVHNLSTNAIECSLSDRTCLYVQDACRHSQLLWRRSPQGQPEFAEERGAEESGAQEEEPRE
jgi:hypothetical protein